jgi:hypothetical protein
MFKVLVIAYYFPPMGLSGVQRTAKFVKYFKNYNWNPTVITTGSIAYFAHDNSLQEEIDKTGVRIIRTKGTEPNSLLSKYGTIKIPGEFFRKLFNRISQSIFVPDNKSSWANKAFETASELLSKEDFDIIFVSIPPFSSFRMAAKLKRKFNIPLFVDYRDLWFGNQFAFYPTPFHKYLNKKMEYNSLRRADSIIVTNRKIKERLINYYQFLTFEDVYIIPHGFDPEDFKNIQIEKKPNNKMIITYSGIFYETITPQYFLKAFKRITHERPDIAANIKLNFIGFLRKENRKLITKLNLQEFISDFGYLPHKEALAKVMLSDVLWMMVGRGRNDSTISSGKLFEYFGTRKPIIASVPEGALKSAAESYGASFITRPDNIEEIKNTIIKVYELYIRKELPVPDENFILQHGRDHLTEILTKQFQNFVKEEIV